MTYDLQPILQRLTRRVDGRREGKRAAKLRCDILRTLVQSPETGSKFSALKFAPGIEETCDSFLADRCMEFVNEAVSGVTAHLIEDSLPDYALSELAEIWKRTAHLFIQLHTQMMRLSWWNPSFYLGERYSGSRMKRHQSHLPGSETDNQVHLVLTPLIHGWGMEDGKRYDEFRIISKATVLVGKIASRRTDISKQ